MKGLLGALTILKHSDYVLQVTHSSNCVYEKEMSKSMHGQHMHACMYVRMYVCICMYDVCMSACMYGDLGSGEPVVALDVRGAYQKCQCQYKYQFQYQFP